MARITKEIQVTRALKFGVEIEFINDVRSELRSAIERRGYVAMVEGYNHNVSGRKWKITTDGSCGYEIVSPILNGMEGIAELKAVCEALNEVGAKVDKRCGVHVHHEAGDFDMENVKNVYRMYHKHIDVLDTMMPVSRRANNNGYCKDIDAYLLNQIEGCANMDELKWLLTHNQSRSSLRYKKVNFCSYLAYGTIEFRHHSGSTDGEKISNWVLLTHMMMQRAKEGKKVRQKSAKRIEHSEDTELAYDFYMEIGISGTDLANYVRVRRSKLKRALVA